MGYCSWRPNHREIWHQKLAKQVLWGPKHVLLRHNVYLVNKFFESLFQSEFVLFIFFPRRLRARDYNELCLQHKINRNIQSQKYALCTVDYYSPITAPMAQLFRITVEDEGTPVERMAEVSGIFQSGFGI